MSNKAYTLLIRKTVGKPRKSYPTASATFTIGDVEMAPATVAHKAFYCTFHGLSGVITKPAATVLFLDPESGAVVTLHDSDYADLVVLGAVDAAMRQYISDMAAGGYAAAACSRQNVEVR